MSKSPAMAISRSAVLKALSDTEEKVRPLAGEMAELVHEVVRQCKQAVWLVPECGIDGEIHDPLVAVRMLAVKLATANAIVVRYDRMIQDMRALYQARIDGSYAEHARGICDRASCAFCERERLQP